MAWESIFQALWDYFNSFGMVEEVSSFNTRHLVSLSTQTAEICRRGNLDSGAQSLEASHSVDSRSLIMKRARSHGKKLTLANIPVQSKL